MAVVSILAALPPLVSTNKTRLRKFRQANADQPTSRTTADDIALAATGSMTMIAECDLPAGISKDDLRSLTSGNTVQVSCGTVYLGVVCIVGTNLVNAAGRQAGSLLPLA